MSDGRWGRWAAVGIVALVAAVFALLNADERISLSLGVVVIYRVPLALLVLVAFLLGMLAMFLLGLRHDLQVRRVLRRHGLDLAEPEPEPEPEPIHDYRPADPTLDYDQPEPRRPGAWRADPPPSDSPL